MRFLSRGQRLALLLAVAIPALADTEFRVRRMTRTDVPFGKGQCDIRLQVDNEAEVSVRGDQVMIRTLAGRDPRDEGSECNEPLPDRGLQGFGFEVKETRGDIRLVAEPSPRNGFRAIVRIRDSKGGEGRYIFRLVWDATASGNSRPGGGYSDDRRNSGPGGAYPDDRRMPPPRQGGRYGAVQATSDCQDAVRDRIAEQYRVRDVDFRNVRADDRSSRGDSIVGDAVASRGNATFAFVCRVDFNAGRVLSVDVRRR